MCLAYSWHRCLEMIGAQELVRGMRYALLVQSRADFVWGQPHPPPSYFLGSDPAVWVPEGEDWGGINDRHAVIERSLADAYFGSGWEDLRSGAAARQLRRRLGPRRALNCTPSRGGGRREDAPCCTHELWLQLRLAARNVRILRFKGSADLYRAESGMLECTRGAALSSNTECLRRVARHAIFTLGLANTTKREADAWARLQRWCELHQREEQQHARPGAPLAPCEPILVDMLLSEEARRQNRGCAEVVLEVAYSVCDPSMLRPLT